MDYQLGPGPLQVDQNTIDEKIKGDIGIVENGDVATHAIPSGYYVIWKGDLYVAKTDISSGTTLSAASNGNLTAKPNGLGAEVAMLNGKTTLSKLYGTCNADYLSAGEIIVFRAGNLCIIQIADIKFKIDIPSANDNNAITLATLPIQASNSRIIFNVIPLNPGDKVVRLRVAGNRITPWWSSIITSTGEGYCGLVVINID